MTLNLKNLHKNSKMANVLCDFSVKIDPSMGRGLIFNRQIADVTVCNEEAVKNC